MSQLEGKEKILKIAIDLIMKHGYNSISARRIAREAEISIGTLYYHFPDGKLSILYDIMASFGAKYMKLIDFTDIQQLVGDPKRSKEYLTEAFKAIREISPLIKGFEVELLTNTKFLESAKKELAMREARNSHLITQLIKDYLPNFIGQERILSILSKLLINTIYIHIILENYYGTDDELIGVLIKLMNGFFNVST
ncbi:MAG: TetR/AcrR family transcriptional regulator [Candidatus Lokiarchaeota archaeon]|nr:TetR/AcrR family transcriptional regulator [Candidatus Lokiarchaeota archaeon]